MKRLLPLIVLCLALCGCSESERQKAEQSVQAAREANNAVGQVAATMPAPVGPAVQTGVDAVDVGLGLAAAALAAWGEFQRRKANRLAKKP